jgi:hypothetical protein
MLHKSILSLIAFLLIASSAGATNPPKHHKKNTYSKVPVISEAERAKLLYHDFLVNANEYYAKGMDTIDFYGFLPTPYQRADSFGLPKRKPYHWKLIQSSIRIDTTYDASGFITNYSKMLNGYKLVPFRYNLIDSSLTGGDTIPKTALVAVNLKNAKDIKHISGPFARIDKIWPLLTPAARNLRKIPSVISRLKTDNTFHRNYHLIESYFGEFWDRPNIVYRRIFDFISYESVLDNDDGDHLFVTYTYSKDYIDKEPFALSPNKRFMIVDYKIRFNMEKPDVVNPKAYRLWDIKRQKFVDLDWN